MGYNGFVSKSILRLDCYVRQDTPSCLRTHSCFYEDLIYTANKLFAPVESLYPFPATVIPSYLRPKGSAI